MEKIDSFELPSFFQTSSHPLRPVFEQVIDQVTKGKGERHGGDRVPFLEQQWYALATTHGVGFLTGQACKKAGEALTKDPEACERELLGAIAYLGMAILHVNRRKEGTPPPTRRDRLTGYSPRELSYMVNTHVLWFSENKSVILINVDASAEKAWVRAQGSADVFQVDLSDLCAIPDELR